MNRKPDTGSPCLVPLSMGNELGWTTLLKMMELVAPRVMKERARRKATGNPNLCRAKSMNSWSTESKALEKSTKNAMKPLGRVENAASRDKTDSQITRPGT